MSEILEDLGSTGTVIGIEVTRLLLRAAVLENGVVRQRYQIPLEYSDPIEARLAAVITELKQNHGTSVFGIAVSGLVNRLTNRIVLSTQIPDLAAIDLVAVLASQTGTRIHLENDANAAAYGEYILGAGRGSRSLFFATIGAGIGGSLILDGKIWRGANGFAGEFGHIAIDEDGSKLEAVASATNIVRRTRERLLQDSTSSLSRELIEKAATVESIVEAANNGDDFAQLMLERTGTYIGTAIASVINLLNVEKVVLGGEVMEAGGVILQSITRRAQERSFQPSFETTSIAAAELGADAAAIGVALLATKLSG
ncbi:MAG: ROK family protein [Pyrinomonadaceae bacterium]